MKRWVFSLVVVAWIGVAIAGLQAQEADSAAPAVEGTEPVPAAAPAVEGTAPVSPAAPAVEATAPSAGEAVAVETPETPAPPAVDLLRSEEIRRQEKLIRARKHLETGESLLKRKNYAAALENLEQALSLFPRIGATEKEVARATRDAARASYFLARQLLAQDNYSAARDKAKAALDYDPSLRSARSLLRDIDAAEKRHQEEIRRGPKVQETPEFKDRKQRVMDNYRRGKEYFHVGEYEKAREMFEKVLMDDPYHSDAKRFMKAIADRDYNSATRTQETLVAERLAEVREAWNPRVRRALPTPGPETTASPIPGQDTETITKKLNDIIIPQLEFVDANITDVVTFLVTTSREIDPEGKGVNIILKLQPTLSPYTTQDMGLPTDLGAGGFPGMPGLPGTAGGAAGGGAGFPPGFPGAPGGGAAAGGAGMFPGAPAGGGAGMFPGAPAGGGAFPGGMPGPGGATGYPGADLGAGGPDLTGAAAPGVIPQITMNLRDIPLIDAIRYVTEVAGLKYRIEPNAVIITPLADQPGTMVTRIYPVQPALFRTYFVQGTQQDQQQQQRSSSRGDYIQMAGGGQLVSAAMISAMVRQFFMEAGVPFPPGSTVTYNERISTLIVKNTPENLELFERILTALNVIPYQVEIEAKFIDIAQDDLEELGLQWFLTDDYEFIAKKGPGPISARERLEIPATNLTGGLRYVDTVRTGAVTDSGSGGTSGVDLLTPSFDAIMAFRSVLTNPEVAVVLRALDQQLSQDVLSSPKITTISGQQAQFRVVEELIYPTDYDVTEPTVNDAGTIITPAVIEPTDFETREVGVLLNVTPTVGADGYTINLAIIPEVSELVRWQNYGYTYAGQDIPLNQPIFASRNLTTNVIIWDGQTVVLGGMITEKLSKVNDKVPILGDVPVLGRLFRSQAENSEKRNLLIFVTARLVDPSGAPIHRMEDVTDLFGSASVGGVGGLTTGPGGLATPPSNLAIPLSMQ